MPGKKDGGGRASDDSAIGSGAAERARRALKDRRVRQDTRLSEIMGSMPGRRGKDRK